MLFLKFIMFSSIDKCNSGSINRSGPVTRRLTNEEKEQYKLEGFLREVLIGNILGEIIFVP